MPWGSRVRTPESFFAGLHRTEACKYPRLHRAAVKLFTYAAGIWTDSMAMAGVSITGFEIMYGRNITLGLTSGINGIMVLSITQKGGDSVTVMSIRMPDEVATWLRQKAAKGTVKQNKQVSINSLVVAILTKAMKADKKKGG